MCGKHIVDPIPIEEWKCPKCGAGSDSFIIDESDTDDDSCELDHENDICRCTKCEGAWTLKTVISKWRKAKSLIKCPHCNGTGWIQKEKA